MGSNFANRETSSGVEIPAVAGPSSEGLGEPGGYPFTRGPYPDMYRSRLWTMRQYAGYGDADETNARFQALLAGGQTGLSVAFDLPTQMGLDSDDPMAAGEVGKVGVAIDTLDDMRRLFAGIPLGRVTTSMTINATAAILLLLYQLVAEEEGVSPEEIRGTVQNDILKEYIARGTYIYPPGPSMRLVTDLFEYCHEQLPNWNTISISGYHIREAGSTAAEELGFTLANGVAYVEAAARSGLDVNDFAPRLSFFWNSHSNFLEEVAKFRAGRRLWARLMKERLGATDPAAMRMRFHTQTAGSTLTAQQPLTNVVRTAYQALAAVLGGTQSLHTNSYDEALGLPTEDAAMLALRTQQILAFETGVADSADPLAGSYLVEYLTDELEARATEIVEWIDSLGGAVAAIEAGAIQARIGDSAYRAAQALESGEAIVVGLNRFVSESEPVPPLVVDQALEETQAARVRRHREKRGSVDEQLGAVASAAADGGNLLVPIKAALEAGATVGEVAGALRGVFGRFRP